MRHKKIDKLNNQPFIEELEPRILFSAGLEGVVLDSLTSDGDALALYQHKDEASLQPATEVAAESVVSAQQELVFIDTNTPDYQTLINDLLANNDENRTIHWVLLDSDKDGLQQISDTLAKYHDLDAVHIISHGSDGKVQLGNSQLDIDSLLANTDTISNWGDAFSEDGDLLFYGCNLAATENGQSLINSIANLTGTDVAASEDLTGSAELGGDWKLEYESGRIETNAAFSAEIQQGWSGILVIHESNEVGDKDLEIRTIGDQSWGQSFRDTDTSGTYTVNQLSVWLRHDGASAQNITVSLQDQWNGSGSINVSATKTWAELSLDSSFARYDFDIANTTLNYGSTYSLRVSSSTSSGNVYVAHHDAFNIYTQGDLINDSGSTESGKDMLFLITEINSSAPPVNSVPGAQSTDEDTALVFNTTNGNLISISDADAGSSVLAVSLSVNDGIVTLSGTAGLTFISSSNGSTAMTFSGTLTDINAALDGLTFNPDADFNGAVTLQMTTHDDTTLQGYYSFDISGDLGKDSSIAGTNDGVVNGAAPPVPADPAPRDKTLEFDEGDHIQINGRFDDPADVTLAAWVNLTAYDTAATDTGSHVISLGDDVILYLREWSGGGLRGSYYDGTSWQNLDYGINLLGGWHHIAYTVDAVNNTHTLYLNGVAVDSAAMTGAVTYSHGADSFIGKHGTGDPDWDFIGKIDEARVYNRALTSQEISALANDTLINADTDSVTITVNPVNDAPTLAGNALNPTYTEGNAAVGLFNFVSPNTSDSGQTIEELVFTVTNVTDGSPQGNSERITLDGSTFALTDLASGTTANKGYSYSISLSGTTATVTLSTPGASIADISNLVISLSYQNSSETPSTLNRAFTITSIKDSGGTANGGIDTSSPNLVSTVTIVAVNDAPVTNNVSANGNEDDASITITLTGSDIDGTVVNFQLTTLPANGTLYLDAGLSMAVNTATDYAATAEALTLYFVPNANYNGVTTFDFAAKDNNGQLDASAATASITVNAINDAPAATNLGAPEAYIENSILYLTDIVITDVDSANVTATLTLSDPAAGNLSIGVSGAVASTYNAVTGMWSATGVIADVNILLAGVVFSPSTNYNSNFTIATSIDDGIAPASTGVKNITGLAVNNAPVFSPTFLDEFTTATFTNNDGSNNWTGSWIESDSSGAGATVGMVIITGGELNIQGFGNSLARQANLSNATSASLSFDFRTGSGVESSDPDSWVIEVSNNGGSSWAILETFDSFDGINSGSRSYDISAYTSNNTQIRFRVDNGFGGPDEIFYIDNVRIQYANSISIAENTAAVTTVIATDADLPAQTLSYSIIGGDDAAEFSLDSITGVLTFISPPDFEIPDDSNGDNIYDVIVQVSDGILADVQALQITVTDVNDAPITNNVSASGNEDAPSIAITLTGSDIDGTVDNFQLTNLPANGILYTDAGLSSVAIIGTDYAATAESLTLYFAPNLNYNGITAFGFVAKDNGGLLDATPATATLTVNAVNDTPTTSGISNVVVNEDAPDSIINLFAAFDDVEDLDPALTTQNSGHDKSARITSSA